MAKIPRRSLDELYAKYDLHPDIFDIYVEGKFDHDFLNLFLEQIGYAANVSVFSVDDVDISGDILDGFGLGHGSNKLRVVALSKLLDEKYESRLTNIFCLVDVDESKVLNEMHLAHHLKYTDFACAEMYMLNKKTLSKFLMFTCQLTETYVEEFVRLCHLVLPTQFALRATNIFLGLNKATRSFENGLREKRNFFSFDPGKYCANYISASQLQKRTSEIEAVFNGFMEKLRGDIRDFSHGHDFIYLLFTYMAAKAGMKFQNNDENDILKFGRRLLSLAVDMSDLATEPLFLKIRKSIEGEEVMCSS